MSGIGDADLSVARESSSSPQTARLERALGSGSDGLDADARALLLVAALEDGDSGELFEAAEVLRDAAQAVVAAVRAREPDRGIWHHTDQTVHALRIWQAARQEWDLGHWQESERLFREAKLLGLPPFEDAEASFYLETFAGLMASGVGMVRAFTRLADDLLAKGEGRKALEALATTSVRAYWEKLDAETRSAASAVAKRIDVPSDEPLRLCFLAYVDPIRNGREVIEQLGQLSPAGIRDSDALSQLGHAATAVWADDLAISFLSAAAGSFRVEGRLGSLGTALAFEAWSHLHRGAVSPAMTVAAESARVAAEANLTLYLPAAKLAEAVAVAQCGEDDAAQALIAQAEAILLPLGATPLLALVALARGRVELAAGRFAAGYASLSRLFDPTDVAFHPFVRGTALADLVDAAKGCGRDLDLIEAQLVEWHRIAADTRAPHLQVQLSYAAAILAADEQAEELFEVAGAAGWPFYAARARLAHGVWLRRQRRSSDARAPLREALETFVALGQESYAARAQSELRATGETARRRVPEAWSQLTPQESQIAQLAAEGLSNKEIGGRLYLSPRTIGTHLYHVFPKLGITSRAELRDVLTGSVGTSR